MGQEVTGTAGAEDLRPERGYTLPLEMRTELGMALGPVYATADLKAALKGFETVIAVGDMVSHTLKQLDILPRLFVCDYHTQRGQMGNIYRKALGTWGSQEYRVSNPAGGLTREAWEAVHTALRNSAPSPVRIVVDGEEDLVGLAVLMEAPMGAAVIYGMPSQGVCVATVTPELRQRVAGFIRRMTPM